MEEEECGDAYGGVVCVWAPLSRWGEELEKAGVTSTKENAEQFWSLHQDNNMQSRWPKVNVGSRVFSFLLHEVGSDLYASVMISFVAAQLRGCSTDSPFRFPCSLPSSLISVRKPSPIYCPPNP